MSTNPGPEPTSTNKTVLKTERLELSFGTDQDARDLFPFVHGEPGRAVTDNLLWNGPETVEDIAVFLRKHTTGTFDPDGFSWLIRDRTGEFTGKVGQAMGVSASINAVRSAGATWAIGWRHPIGVRD